MVIAAFVFGLVIFALSLFLVFSYIQSDRSMQQQGNSLARQRALQVKLQADLQARVEADTRKFEEDRRSLLERAGVDPKRPDVEDAA